MSRADSAILNAYDSLSQASDVCLERFSSIDPEDSQAREKAFGDVLTVVAKTLFGVSQTLSGEGAPARMYFWPGYNSVIQSTAISTPVDHGDKRKLHRFTLRDPDGNPCGVELPAFEENGRDLTASAFAQLLTVQASDLINGVPFQPGGTHDWVSAGNFISPLNVPLQILEIQVGSEEETEDAPDAPGVGEIGLLPIRLPPHSPELWAEVIQRSLREGTRAQAPGAGAGELGPRPWPYVLGGNELPTGETSNPPPSSESDEFEKQEELRRNLYNIWLSTFMRSLGTGNSNTEMAGEKDYNFIDEGSGLATILGLTALSERIKGIQKRLQERAASSRPEYRYWYTLRIRPTVKLKSSRLRDTEELGTAMLMTTTRLDPVFFILATPWIERIYEKMRYLESSMLLEREGRQHVLTDFSHEMRDLRLLIYNSLRACKTISEQIIQSCSGGSCSSIHRGKRLSPAARSPSARR
jgi:hypothetical protein